MQKRCLTCRKVPEKSLSEGERKDSHKDLSPLLCGRFFATWFSNLTLGGQCDHMRKKGDC